MAEKEKKATIVIKKINVVAGGAHGGSWKVAFADFMTAMMAFFLVMWLVGQSEEVKKSVSDYFSTPSIIEYNFANYGVELTLEKLFLDLVNEPLKAFEQFITPVDRKPNIMEMGTQKIQVHFLADKLGELATNVNITSDEITFDIPEEYLFKPGNAEPASQFVQSMERIRGILEGLKDVDVYVNSELPYASASQAAKTRNVAESRLDLITNRMNAALESQTVDIFGKTTVERVGKNEKRDTRGFIKFRIRQKNIPKQTAAKGQVEEMPDPAKRDVYEDFVDELTRKAEGR